MTTTNYNYSIKSLKGAKFYGNNNVVCEIKGGFGLHVEGKGFISFIGANIKNGVKTPYMNTRKVLKEIIDMGGLVDFSQTEFLEV